MTAKSELEHSVTRPWPGKRILIVDRYQLPAVTFGQYLRLQGYEVEAADDARSAMRLVDIWPPDLIVLDMDLPPREGLAFLKRLVKESKRQCPVLVFTALRGMEEFCHGLPIEAFVRKSMYGKDLLQAVERILNPELAIEEGEIVPLHRHVLLAEDDQGVADNIRQSFALKGYEVDVLRSGPEVLEVGADLHPDVIILKQVLSGMNGMQVAARLKSTGRLREVPIILYDQPPQVGGFHKFELKPPEGVDAFVASAEAALLLRAVDRQFSK